MSDIAIRVEGLSKQYRIGEQERYKALRDVITDAAASPFRKMRSAFGNGTSRNGSGTHDSSLMTHHSNHIWALDDVSFEVKRGEVVGIIGRNGAGKSTLLKILSRITKPTKGHATIHGRVGSLLEVGTGFHPELTGRENIFLNAAILGMRKAEVERKFDEIVAFAEVEKFIDTPVKRYSSGMYVRLAFAVAAHMDTEILIVDEVLAVGDAQFQKKCLGKMGGVAKDGRTVLFVSHSMSAVQQLCQKGLVLDAGQLVHSGIATNCIRDYLSSSGKSETILSHVRNLHPDLKITSITINGSPNDRVELSAGAPRLELIVDGFVGRPMRIEVEAVITDLVETRLGFYSPGHERGYTDLHPAGIFRLVRNIALPDRMNRGEYYLNLYLTQPNVISWAEIQRGARLIAPGTATETGRILDYHGGAGWIFLSGIEDSTIRTPIEKIGPSEHGGSDNFH